MAREQTLFRATKKMKSWRTMIAHILKGQKKNKNLTIIQQMSFLSNCWSRYPPSFLSLLIGFQSIFMAYYSLKIEPLTKFFLIFNGSIILNWTITLCPSV